MQKIPFIRLFIAFIISFILLNFIINEYYSSLFRDERIRSKYEIIDLNKQLEKTNKKYEETIKTIVNNVKLSDSYLFTGGTEDLEQNGTISMYEEILTMENDLDYLLSYTDNFFQKRTDYLSKIPNIFPVEISQNNRITSLFGSRISPITGGIIDHNGIDITSSYGSKVLATASGIVKAYYPNHWLYGRYIVISHIDGYESHYAHLDKNYVRRGDKVVQGQAIGLMGNSGRSFGIHLHYMVTKNDVPQNPIFYLRKSE